MRLPSRGDALALVPWADFVNHAPECSAHLDWDGGCGAVVLRTERPYAAGEQVFASYGQRASADLLLTYGFAPPGNPHESALLALQLPGAADDPVRAAKAAALAAHGRAAAERFLLRAGGAYTPDLLPWAAFAAAPLRGAATAAEDAAALAAATFAPQPAAGGGGWAGLFGGGGGGGRGAVPRIAGGAAAHAAGIELVLAALRAAVTALDVADAAANAPAAAPRAKPAKRGRAGAAAAGASQPPPPRPDAGRAAAAAAIRGAERKIVARAEFVLRAELRQLTGGGSGVRLGQR